MNGNPEFSHVTEWSKLKTGWEREKVFITSSPVPVVGNFLYKTNVLHNNWKTRKRIVFENGKILNVRDETIDGKRVYIFLDHPALEVLWIQHNDKHRKSVEIKRIRDLLPICPPDVICIAEVVVSTEACLKPRYLNSAYPSPVNYAADRILQGVELLGLKQLRNIRSDLEHAVPPPSERVTA